MASTLPALLPPRDYDILEALDRSPLTVPQLHALSASFSYPFTTERKLRARMQVLATRDLVRRYLYPTAGPGVPVYFTLSPEGYRVLYGHDAKLPSKHAFLAVGFARLRHTLALADFIVHTAVAARGADCRLENFHRENTLKLQVGTEFLYPDCAFELTDPRGQRFSYYVEVDNGTERVVSAKSVDSWERKIVLYDRHQDEAGHRFRVLVITTGGSARLTHILALAAERVRNPRRSLFYGIRLGDYLAAGDPLHAPCFTDQRSLTTSLVPQHRTPSPATRAVGSTLENVAVL